MIDFNIQSGFPSVGFWNWTPEDKLLDFVHRRWPVFVAQTNCLLIDFYSTSSHCCYQPENVLHQPVLSHSHEGHFCQSLPSGWKWIMTGWEMQKLTILNWIRMMLRAVVSQLISFAFLFLYLKFPVTFCLCSETFFTLRTIWFAELGSFFSKRH